MARTKQHRTYLPYTSQAIAGTHLINGNMSLNTVHQISIEGTQSLAFQGFQSSDRSHQKPNTGCGQCK